MLDEYYLCGESLSREDAKNQVKIKSNISVFAKPKKHKNGIYARVMESDKFFYNRFYDEIKEGEICFNCHAPISGKVKDFNTIVDGDDRHHFCSYQCQRETWEKIHSPEGEWQNREGYDSYGTYGYIYHIYNRRLNKHYVGQSKYMPFFRWQEHAKQNIKGDICDLVFDTICEIKGKNQEYLNSIEAWWIRKFIDDYGRKNVINITVPKITMESLKQEYENIISKSTQLSL